jgi:hypothetical protein
MVCENCKRRIATVHLSGWKKVRAASNQGEQVEHIDHHFCDHCAAELKESSDLLKPLGGGGQDARTMKVRVIGVTLDHVVLKEICSKAQATPQEWSFLRGRLPTGYAKLGMEFEMTFNNTELEWLQGRA